MSFFQKKPVLIAVSIVATILFASMATLFLVTFIELNNVRDGFVEYKNNAELEENVDDGSLSAENRRLERLLTSAEEARTSLENKIETLEDKILELQKSSGDSSVFDELNSELAELKKSLEEKNSEIETLKRDIRMTGISGVTDLNAQYDIISKILSKIENAPKNVNDKSVVTEHGVPVTDGKGNVVYETVVTDPTISVYYYDLTRGYKYSYNEKQTFSTSGFEKLILAYQLLSARSSEEIQNATRTSGEKTSVYNFDTVYKYTSSDYVAGAGVIRENGEGKTYTHAELISIMLENCDSVAYKALTSAYGTKNMKSKGVEFGMTVKNGETFITAEAMGKLLESVYDFTVGTDKYAEMTKTAMNNSVHSILSGYSVSSNDVGHMCAWDDKSYSDAVIVYGEHPYIVVIMTDMTEGGNEVKTFFGDIVSLIDELHLNFGG